MIQVRTISLLASPQPQPQPLPLQQRCATKIQTEIKSSRIISSKNASFLCVSLQLVFIAAALLSDADYKQPKASWPLSPNGSGRGSGIQRVSGAQQTFLTSALQTQLRCSAPAASFGASLDWVKIQSGPSDEDAVYSSVIDSQHRRIVTASACSAKAQGLTPAWQGACRHVYNLDTGELVDSYEAKNADTTTQSAIGNAIAQTPYNFSNPQQVMRAVWTANYKDHEAIQFLQRSATPTALNIDPFVKSAAYGEIASQQSDSTRFADAVIDSIGNLTCVVGDSQKPTLFGQSSAPYSSAKYYMFVACFDSRTGVQRAAKIMSTPHNDAGIAMTLYRSATHQALGTAATTDALCVTGYSDYGPVDVNTPVALRTQKSQMYVECLSLWPPSAPTLLSTLKLTWDFANSASYITSYTIDVNRATGRIFVGGQFKGTAWGLTSSGVDGDLFLLSIQMQTQTLEWAIKKSGTDSTGEDLINSLTVDQRTGLVYASASLDFDSYLYCFDPDSGRLIYQSILAPNYDISLGIDLSMAIVRDANLAMPNQHSTLAIPNGRNVFTMGGWTSSSNLGGSGIAIPFETYDGFIAKFTEHCDYCLATGTQAVCKNGALACVNSSQNDFTCTCKPGWKGKSCSENNICAVPNTCKNGAQCTTVGTTGQDFACQCPTSWSGKDCSVNNICAIANKCKNGSICAIKTPTGQDFTCTCAKGWTGLDCSLPSPCLQAGQCANGGSCVDVQSTGGFTCACQPGWKGARCNENNICTLANTCKNGAQCTTVGTTGQDFACQCPTSYKGKDCSVNNICAVPNKCKNGGTCATKTPQGQDFTCQCAKGWQGLDCSTRVISSSSSSTGTPRATSTGSQRSSSSSTAGATSTQTARATATGAAAGATATATAAASLVATSTGRAAVDDAQAHADGARASTAGADSQGSQLNKDPSPQLGGQATTQTTDEGSKSNMPLIIGAAAGGILLLGLIASVIICMRRRSSLKQKSEPSLYAAPGGTYNRSAAESLQGVSIGQTPVGGLELGSPPGSPMQQQQHSTSYARRRSQMNQH